jgi:TRAP-type C4-dicarboxylate transport system permease small subunit
VEADKEQEMPADPAQPKLRWEHLAVTVLMSVMCAITFLNVLSRYVLGKSFGFTEEVTPFCFVLLTVVGTGLAFERGSHLGVSLLVERFPVGLRRVQAIVSAILSAALFAAVVALVIRVIYFEITLFNSTSPSLGLPMWIYYAGVVPLSFSVFRGIYRGLRRGCR